MSETQDPKDFPLFATSRSQKKKKQTASAETSSSSTEQTDPVLNKIRALSTRSGNIDGRFDTIENHLDAISTSVSAIHKTLSNLSQRVSSSEMRLMEAENRISTTEDALRAREGVNDPPQSVLVRFVRYADRERILQTALKKRLITYESKQTCFFQDLSVYVMRKRREFDVVKKILVDGKMLRGFAYPAKLRCFHDSELRTFSTPAAVEEFIETLQDK
ncbi:LINE-1 retrotransposable element ORF1 protein [Anabarilius grahami]|uniref:LINE-1 retrotransposable element ORF1 protein n=1 Tax=Anabarilius grahami TaxID=495550 RepID=A0A3N0Z4Q9_ANAGA|nr:LINE-1 retrotransposable element ORF1 protein [Anabarilius grahami]